MNRPTSGSRPENRPRRCPALHPVDQIPIVDRPLFDLLVQPFRHAARIQLLLGLIGQAFDVGGAVMENRDLLVAPMIGQVIAGHDALNVVATDHAEDVGQPALGERRIGRHWRDHQDPGFGIDRRRRDRGVGAGVAGDEDHAFTDELVRQSHRLLAIAGVVADDHSHLLAENPACGIELGHGELSRLSELILPGYRHPPVWISASPIRISARAAAAAATSRPTLPRPVGSSLQRSSPPPLSRAGGRYSASFAGSTGAWLPSRQTYHTKGS